MIYHYLSLLTYIFLMILNAILGAMIMQFTFVISHLIGHSLFLEKNNALDINSRFHQNPPIIDHANYHHQHNPIDNWFPEISYYGEKKEEGMRSIVVSHWHGYTLLGSPFTIVYVAFLGWLQSNLLLMIAFYEIYVLLLPYDHGWQHLPKKTFHPIIQVLFPYLENLGIVASGEDHNDHHKHFWHTVYRGFSSSGFYLPRLDKVINAFWDSQFYRAYLNNLGIDYDKVNITEIHRQYNLNEPKEIIITPKKVSKKTNIYIKKNKVIMPYDLFKLYATYTYLTLFFNIPLLWGAFLSLCSNK